MKKQFRSIPLFIVLALLASGLFVFFLTQKGVLFQRKVQIVLVHSITEDDGALLKEYVQRFDRVNPQIEVQTIFVESTEKEEYLKEATPDLLIWNGPAPDQDLYSWQKAVLWSGSTWFVAANTSLFNTEELGILTSDWSLDSFNTLLRQLDKRGVPPLALGNSHLWTLSLWSQHLLAPEISFRESFPLPGEVLTDSPDSNWEMLKRWYGDGYFLKETWSSGWASGVSAMARGEAAMCLMSGNMLSTIPRNERKKVRLLPFPGSVTQDKRWAIGNGTSIVIGRAKGAQLKASLSLLNFLSSPVIVDELSDRMGRSFFSTQTNTAEVYFPSWENLANQSDMREYGTKLNDFVTRK